jgi:CubicO group peptidase (beta-lactamase class C family)
VKITRVSVVLLAWLVAGVVARGGEERDLAEKIDAAVDAQRQAQKIPGVSLAVCRNGKVVKVTGYGLGNVEWNGKVTPETIFQTGSVGKQFTSMAVMMLVEEGKIALDEKLSKYIPESPEIWRDVTIRNLLSHTSGIADYAGDNGPLGNAVVDIRRDYTEQELIAAFAKMKMDFQPGEKWNYSNTGYVLLGIVIRRVTARFYGDVLQERIFKPLEMNSTQIISEADIVPQRAAGYRLVQGALKNQEWVAPTLNTTADGALYTNVLDLAKWDAALREKRFLKASSYELMWSPVKLNDGKTYPYGFGWFLEDRGGFKAVSHTGSWQGFTMAINRYEKDGLTVIVMTNLDSDHCKPEKIAEDVAVIYLK